MPNCLLALGSNLGDSVATLRAAIEEIAALPDIRLVRQSGWHRTLPVGGPAAQAEFVNAAALIETTAPPLTLLADLHKIEDRHDRVRAERWGPRTLDIDLLLYGNEVSETEMLTLPHPRMTFRRFVLEPAVEITPKMLHPVVGWPLQQLLLHLRRANDSLAIVSLSDAARTQLTDFLLQNSTARPTESPKFETADHHWPPLWTSWLSVIPTAQAANSALPRTELPYAAAAFPKLSILLDADVAHRGADKLRWSTLVRQPGRGPMLRLQTTVQSEIETEVLAAITAVWA